MKLAVVQLGFECFLLFDPQCCRILCRNYARFKTVSSFVLASASSVFFFNLWEFCAEFMSWTENEAVVSSYWSMWWDMQISYPDIPGLTGWRVPWIACFLKPFSPHTYSRWFEELQIGLMFRAPTEMVHETRNRPQIGLTLHVLSEMVRESMNRPAIGLTLHVLNEMSRTQRIHL